MAKEEIKCPYCQSEVYKNGINCGCQRYKCRNEVCRKTFQRVYNNIGATPGIEGIVLKLLEENNSLRGISRILGISMPFIFDFLKKKLMKSNM
jgi:transposase-like protein